MIQNVATLSTENSYPDLAILLESIFVYSPNLKVYILCDSYVENLVTKCFSHIDVVLVNYLDKYARKTRKEMEQEGIWLTFMLEKCTIIDYVLERSDHVLFLDADIILLNSIDNLVSEDNFSKDIGLSYHEINARDELLYGKYNGGFVFVKNKGFTKWWRTASFKSSFFEQKALDDVPRCFKTFLFSSQDNFGWWRLYQSSIAPQEVAKQFSVKDDKIFYKNKQLNSIHTHLRSDFPYTVGFNRFIKSLVMSTNDGIMKEILNFH